MIVFHPLAGKPKRQIFISTPLDDGVHSVIRICVSADEQVTAAEILERRSETFAVSLSANTAFPFTISISLKLSIPFLRKYATYHATVRLSAGSFS